MSQNGLIFYIRNYSGRGDSGCLQRYFPEEQPGDQSRGARQVQLLLWVPSLRGGLANRTIPGEFQSQVRIISLPLDLCLQPRNVNRTHLEDRPGLSDKQVKFLDKTFKKVGNFYNKLGYKDISSCHHNDF